MIEYFYIISQKKYEKIETMMTGAEQIDGALQFRHNRIDEIS